MRTKVGAEVIQMQLDRPLATVTPTLDGDVLAILARSPASAFTAGQLHRMYGRHSDEGIRKVLNRLTRQGVVTSERVGNAYAYRFNVEHLAAEHIVALADLGTTFVHRIESELARWAQPATYAVLYGSAARGGMREDSDIDLLLVRSDEADEDIWQHQISELVHHVARWTGNDVRPIDLSETEFAEQLRREAYLREATSAGRVLAGRSAWAASLLGVPSAT